MEVKQQSYLNKTSTTKGRRGCACDVCSLGPYCGGVCKVEVSLTILELTETDGQTGGQTDRRTQVSIGRPAPPKIQEAQLLQNPRYEAHNHFLPPWVKPIYQYFHLLVG